MNNSAKTRFKLLQIRFDQAGKLASYNWSGDMSGAAPSTTIPASEPSTVDVPSVDVWTAAICCWMRYLESATRQLRASLRAERVIPADERPLDWSQRELGLHAPQDRDKDFVEQPEPHPSYGSGTATCLRTYAPARRADRAGPRNRPGRSRPAGGSRVDQQPCSDDPVRSPPSRQAVLPSLLATECRAAPVRSCSRRCRRLTTRRVRGQRSARPRDPCGRDKPGSA